MKTRNRIITLLLAACLLLSMGAVSVWAAETAVAEKTVEYSFLYTGSVDLSKFSTGSNSQGKYIKLDDTGITGLNEYYDNGTLNSAPFYYNLNVYNTANNKPTNRPSATATSLTANAYVGDWVAVKIKSPGAGEYAVTVTPGGGTSSAKSCNVYIFPAAADKDVISGEISSYLANQNGLSQGKFVGSLKLLTNVEAATVGNFQFAANDAYIVVFQAAEQSGKSGKEERADLLVVGMTMTQSVTADNVAAEISNAPCGSTIKLNADCDTGAAAVTVGKGVTMDLNGKTLTATVNATQGIVTDSSNDEGSIVGSSAVVKTGANEVAIKSGNTYKIFDYTMNVEETAEEKDNGSVSFWFKVDLSDAALGLIDDGTTDFAVGATMQWTPTEGASSSKNVALEAAEVTKWAGLMQEGDYWFYLNVTGFDTLGDVAGTLTVTPTISGNAGTPINYSVN